MKKIKLYSFPKKFKFKRQINQNINAKFEFEEADLNNNEITELINMLNQSKSINQIDNYVSKIKKILIETCTDWLSKVNTDDYNLCTEILKNTSGFSSEVIQKGYELILKPIINYLQNIDDENLKIIFNYQSDDIEPNYISLAGNIPGSGIYSIFYHLLLGIPAFIKLSSGDLIFPLMLWKYICQKFKDIQNLFAFSHWKHDNWKSENYLFSYFNRAILYGNNQTIEKLSKNFIDFIPYGHRMSFGIIDAESNHNIDEISLKLAHDICYFDQQGCLSPLLYYVIGDYNKAVNWGNAIFKSLENVNRILPVGKRNIEIEKEIPQFRSNYFF